MFNLTREERRVILFLLTVTLIGLGINFLRKKYAPVEYLVCFDKDAGKIELNKAGKDELMSVSGIGEKIAERIISYRQEKGEFNSVEEIRQIKGITEFRYKKIKDSLTTK